MGFVNWFTGLSEAQGRGTSQVAQIETQPLMLRDLREYYLGLMIPKSASQNIQPKRNNIKAVSLGLTQAQINLGETDGSAMNIYVNYQLFLGYFVVRTASHLRNLDHFFSL